MIRAAADSLLRAVQARITLETGGAALPALAQAEGITLAEAAHGDAGRADAQLEIVQLALMVL